MCARKSRVQKQSQRNSSQCIRLKIGNRKKLTITRAGECSDIAAEMAAALAHSAVAFKSNNELSSLYWTKAKQAFNQTSADSPDDVTSSSDTLTDLQNYYRSTSPRGHVFYGAASMWVACQALDACDDDEAEYYKDLANGIAGVLDFTGGRWYWEQAGWDNAWWDAAMLMAQQGEEGPIVDGNIAFPHFLEVFAYRWVGGEVDEFSPIRCASLSSSVC